MMAKMSIMNMLQQKRSLEAIAKTHETTVEAVKAHIAAQTADFTFLTKPWIGKNLGPILFKKESNQNFMN